jgi:hypothetical protein
VTEQVDGGLQLDQTFPISIADEAGLPEPVIPLEDTGKSSNPAAGEPTSWQNPESKADPTTEDPDTPRSLRAAGVDQVETVINELTDASSEHFNFMDEGRDEAAIPSPIDLTGRSLRLRSTEREFLPLLAPLLPTPRAIKKLTNLYRLVRISVPEDKIDDFVGDRSGGRYQAVALLLAAIIGFPDEALPFVLEITSERVERDQDIVDFLAALSGPPIAGILAQHIREIRRTMPVFGSIGTYKSAATLVSRFSFETYYIATNENG